MENNRLDKIEREILQQTVSIDSTLINEILHNLRVDYKNLTWETKIHWRELLQNKLNLDLYWEQAIELNQWAIEGAQALHRADLLARFTHDTADLKSQRGDYTNAIPLYEQSFHTFEELKDYRSATKSYHMLAVAKRALGDLKSAQEIAEECVRRSVIYDMGVWRAHPLHVLAFIARDQGQYEKAIALFEEALKLHKELSTDENAHMIAQANYDLARTLLISGKAKQAEQHIVETYIWSEKAGIQRLRYMGQKLEGDLALKLGDLTRANQLYFLALDGAQTATDEQRIAQIYIQIGLVYFRLFRPIKGVRYLFLAITALIKMNMLTTRTLSRISNRIKRYLKIPLE